MVEGRTNHVDLTLLHSEQPKLYRVLAVLSAVGLKVNGYTFREVSSSFLARLDKVQEELLYYPRHWRRRGVGVALALAKY